MGRAFRFFLNAQSTEAPCPSAAPDSLLRGLFEGAVEDLHGQAEEAGPAPRQGDKTHGESRRRSPESPVAPEGLGP
jgi:hypothetical protein